MRVSQLIVILLLVGVLSTPVFGLWWNSSWAYRQNITLNGSTSALTNYQINLLLNSTKVGANFNWTSDNNSIRFLNDSNGGTQLNYWIESWNITGQTASIWINDTSVPIGLSTVWMYYGNPSATSNSNLNNLIEELVNDSSFNNAIGAPWIAGTYLIRDTTIYYTTPASGQAYTPDGTSLDGTHGYQEILARKIFNASEWIKINILYVKAYGTYHGSTLYAFYYANGTIISNIQYCYQEYACNNAGGYGTVDRYDYADGTLTNSWNQFNHSFTNQSGMPISFGKVRIVFYAMTSSSVVGGAKAWWRDDYSLTGFRGASPEPVVLSIGAEESGGDTTPPSIQIQVPANTSYSSSSVDLNYTVSDNIAVSQCKYELDGANTSLPTCANTTLTGLSWGGHNVKIWANDTSNNWNVSASISFTVDTILPSIQIQSPTNTTYNISTISLNFTVSDNIAVSQCFYELNGAANVSIANCLNTTISPPDGSNNIKLWVNDTANNWNSTPLVYFVKDTTPPNITLVNLSSNITSDNTPTFIGNTTDALSAITSVGYRLNGGGWQAATATDGAFNSLFENYMITTSTLSDGNYLIEVRSWDALGNIVTSYPSFNFTVDTVAPSVSIQLPANTTYASTSQTLNFTASDINGISSCKYELNGANTTLATCQNTTFTATEGSNTIKVWANDTVNNWGSNSISFTVDTITPSDIVFVNPTEVDGANKSQTYYYVNATFTEVNPDVCSLEVNSANVSMSRTATYCYLNRTGQSQGVYTYKIFVNDTAGHINSSATRTLRLDTTAPVTTDNAPAGWQTTDFTVTLTPTDTGGAGVNITRYNLDAGGWTTGTSISITTDLNHSIQYYSTDLAGNIESTKTIYAALDKTPPNVNIQLPVNNTWYTSLSRTLNYTVSDNIGISQCKQELNGANTTLATCQNNSFSATEGTNNIAVWVNDTANNWNRSIMITFYTDTVPPTINIQQPTQGTWYTTTNRTLNYTAWDLNGLSICKYELNGANTTIGTCINTTFTAVQGSNTIKIWANDTKTNWNVSATITFNVDSIPPNINIQFPANTTYNSPSRNLNYTTYDLNGVSQCKYELNGVNTSLPTCLNTTITAVEGGNSIKVWANDTYNNWNVSATTYFTIDTIPPSISISLPANTTYGLSLNRTLNYTIYDVGGLSVCKYELNGVNTTIGGCINTTFIGVEGGNTIKIWANDTSNNWNVSSSVSFTIDTTPPSISIQNPQNTTYTTASISLNFTAWDLNNVSQCKYELNGANTTLSACQNTTITAIEGGNNIKVWANDTSNNWNVSSTIYFSVNTPLPPSNYNPVILLGNLYLLFRDTVNFNSNKLIGISDITLSGGIYYGGIGEIPACDNSKRGLVQFIQNSGVDDSLSVCMRNSTGSYKWRNATLS